MFIGGILSAASWYADVALAALLVLFLLAGIIKGFSKCTKGFFVFVFVVCVSLLLTGLTQDAVTESGLGTSISDGLSSASENWGPAFNAPVTVGEDGKYYIMVEGSAAELGGGDFGIKGAFAGFIADKFGVEDGDTVADAAVGSITSVCVAAIMFLVFVIGITDGARAQSRGQDPRRRVQSPHRARLRVGGLRHHRGDRRRCRPRQGLSLRVQVRGTFLQLQPHNHTLHPHLRVLTQ